MMKHGGENKKGFTIIEVSLVLALAGLIFAMVFLAVPAVQRNERDARRRDDVALFLKKVKDYQTSNRGALPTSSGATSWNNFFNTYMGSNFEDPTGNKYKLKVVECDGDINCNGGTSGTTISKYQEKTDPDKNDFTMLVITRATCDGNQVKRSSNPRKIAVLYTLELSGAYCGNS